jgi:ABC-type multidrug transport system ATPase subunit
MTIQLTNTGKRFNREWIFRNLNFIFDSGNTYAITGPNGSGKSTLLQTIAGAIAPSEGSVQFKTGNGELQIESFNNYIAIVAPYLEVIEEMTALEFLNFHSSFKPLLSSITIKEILEIVGLSAAANKQIRYFSSGMKQRIKLAQAVFSDVPILLLDEPCTNLDETGYALYHQLMNDYGQTKLVIVSSNDKNEFDFCKDRISILDYK